VKFAGLPARVQRPPLEFHALKDEFEGVATYDPSTECQAKHDITLEKSKAQDGHKRAILNVLLREPRPLSASILLKFHLEWQRNEVHTNELFS
jgi:hypothetical protein